MKIRFSLRAAMALTTIACLFVFWTTRPNQLAREFVEAINHKDYQHADSLFHRVSDQRIAAAMARDCNNRISAAFEPQSWTDWFKGERRVRITLQAWTTYSGAIGQGLRIPSSEPELLDPYESGTSSEYFTVVSARGIDKITSEHYPNF
jgi:hypothetical protein